MPKIVPMLWFDDQAEQAARFYCSVFPNSRILKIAKRPENVPGETGAVMMVEFELDGWRLTGLNGGPMFTFSEAVSLTVECKDQAEIDYYWDALRADGGQESACGWLRDKYGFPGRSPPPSSLS